jgi:hypothetical protein
MKSFSGNKLFLVLLLVWVADWLWRQYKQAEANQDTLLVACGWFLKVPS